jgi:hypothetical protein
MRYMIALSLSLSLSLIKIINIYPTIIIYY